MPLAEIIKNSDGMSLIDELFYACRPNIASTSCYENLHDLLAERLRTKTKESRQERRELRVMEFLKRNEQDERLRLKLSADSFRELRSGA